MKLSKTYYINDLKITNNDLLMIKSNYNLNNKLLKKIIQLEKNNFNLKQVNNNYNTISFILKSLCYRQDNYILKCLSDILLVKKSYLKYFTKI